MQTRTTHSEERDNVAVGDKYDANILCQLPAVQILIVKLLKEEHTEMSLCLSANNQRDRLLYML